MTLVPFDPAQLALNLEASKKKISQWIDERKVEYTSKEIDQFRNYSSQMLDTLGIEVQILARQKIKDLIDLRDAKIAARIYPKKRVLLLGLVEGGGCVGSSGFCASVAFTAANPLLVLAASVVGCIDFYFFGKLSCRTINDSFPGTINEKTRSDSSKEKEEVEKVRDRLSSKLTQLKAEVIADERKSDIETLHYANTHTRRVQRNTQQKEIKVLRQRCTSAENEVTIIGKANREIENRLTKSSAAMEKMKADLNAKIVIQELTSANLQATVVQLQNQNDGNVQAAQKAEGNLEKMRVTIGQLHQNNQSTTDDLAQLRIENAANLENAERAEEAIEELRQSNERTVANLAQLQIENANNIQNAQRANRASERAEAAAEELRNTHAETLAQIQRTHQENFAILIRTLRDNPAERPVHRLYQEGLRREAEQRNPFPQPAVDEGALLDELNLAGELPEGDFVEVDYENDSQHSNDGNRAYQPDPQNWGADIQIEMLERDMQNAR